MAWLIGVHPEDFVSEVPFLTEGRKPGDRGFLVRIGRWVWRLCEVRFDNMVATTAADSGS